MEIRPAVPEDHASIERIARASFDRVYAFFAVGATRRSSPLLVADEGGAVVGFLEGRVFAGNPPIGYVYFVAVDPDARGRGAGHLLVEAALRILAAKGATRTFAAVPEGNDASLRLFTSLGFARAPDRAMWRWYGWRGVLTTMRMMIAPHEVLLVRPSG